MMHENMQTALNMKAFNNFFVISVDESSPHQNFLNVDWCPEWAVDA